MFFVFRHGSGASSPSIAMNKRGRILKDHAVPSGILVVVAMGTSAHAHIAADAIGSVRAEGLEPGTTVTELLDRWVDGQLETEQLGEAAQCLAAGESVAHLLGQPEPVPARR